MNLNFINIIDTLNKVHSRVKNFKEKQSSIEINILNTSTTRALLERQVANATHITVLIIIPFNI